MPNPNSFDFHIHHHSPSSVLCSLFACFTFNICCLHITLRSPKIWYCNSFSVRNPQIWIEEIKKVPQAWQKMLVWLYTFELKLRAMTLYIKSTSNFINILTALSQQHTANTGKTHEGPERRKETWLPWSSSIQTPSSKTKEIAQFLESRSNIME